MKLLAALALALSAYAAADDDPVAVLMRVRDRVMAHAEQIPNHTCVETIARDVYKQIATTPPRSCDELLGRRKRAGAGTLVKLTTTDRLRLDVAIADGREIYSWAGAGKFEEKELDELVPSGAIGTGPFAATLLGIFETRDPNFAFEGETTMGGRRLMEYSFAVSQAESHSRVKAGKVWLIAGYTGTLLVDPATADLVRLSVRTEELPRATTLCEVDSTMEYGMVQLGGEEYLLPKLTRERFIEQDASEAENTVTFANCREFRGESTVHFGENLPAASARRDPVAPPFAAGLPVVIDVTSTLADGAAAGDRIEGKLAQPVLDAQRKVLAPAGAPAEGRLMRVETLYGNAGETTIVLRWETLEVNGVKVPLSLTPNRAMENQNIGLMGELRRRPVPLVLPRPGEERYAVFKFTGEHLVVQSSLRTLWVTAAP